VTEPNKEYDEKLEKELWSLFDDGRISYANDKSPEVCQQYIDRAIALISRLIEAEKKQAVIEELTVLIRNCSRTLHVVAPRHDNYVISASYLDERLAELTKETE